jgi:hypothetical protein
VAAATSSAFATAPFMPAAGSVSTRVAPNALNSTRRSIDIEAGMVKTSLYPLVAATKARAMPVLPEVGSTKVVRPGAQRPAASAASIMERPILSSWLMEMERERKRWRKRWREKRGSGRERYVRERRGRRRHRRLRERERKKKEKLKK